MASRIVFVCAIWAGAFLASCLLNAAPTNGGEHQEMCMSGCHAITDDCASIKEKFNCLREEQICRDACTTNIRFAKELILQRMHRQQIQRRMAY